MSASNEEIERILRDGLAQVEAGIAEVNDALVQGFRIEINLHELQGRLDNASRSLDDLEKRLGTDDA